MGTILHFCHQLFATLAAEALAWHVRLINSVLKREQTKLVTPHLRHASTCRLRAGFIDPASQYRQRRHNDSHHRSSRIQFIPTDPFDAALVDDTRVYCGVTPAEPLDTMKLGYRDVLVVTLADLARYFIDARKLVRRHTAWPGIGRDQLQKYFDDVRANNISAIDLQKSGDLLVIIDDANDCIFHKN
jgi:hypothetical protein